MRISEVFASIQGEGRMLGVPSLFIRVSGCNLRCVWCDTPYTSWQPDGEDWDLGRISDWVDSHPRYDHVVVTGGEPMLYEEVEELSRQLHRAGKHITIETAGTVYRPVVCDLMSISPKLANSTPLEVEGGRWAKMHDHKRLQPEVLAQLCAEYDYQLKFVVAEPGDLEEVERTVGLLSAPESRVILMPEGVSADILTKRSAWLVDTCRARGYRFSPRLQVMLYGNRRGV